VSKKHQLSVNHLLGIKDLSRSDINTIFKTADNFKSIINRPIKKVPTLRDITIANVFFENSTRTRLSFELAEKRLSADVINFSASASSVSKGESLLDTINNILAMKVDMVVMRHPNPGAAMFLSNHIEANVINAGDGSHEHPTQALLDLFTIQSEMMHYQKGLDNLDIVLMGDLKHGRTVHSLSKLLSLYNNVKITMVSPTALQMPDSVISTLTNAGHQVIITDTMEGHLSCDVIYQTRIQQERFASRDEADLYRGHFSLNKEIYQKYCRENTVIMHPLPRDSRPEANELDVDLNDLDSLAIFRQAQNGVLVRMALFALTLGVEDQLSQYEKEVNWHTNKR